MAQTVVIAGAMFQDVPAISVPDSSNVYHAFTDVSDTTATASDVASGKVFFDALGVLTTGTASGGAISVVDTQDAHGGVVRTITAVDISADTVSAGVLFAGYTAHDSAGNAIVGTASAGGTTEYASYSLAPSGNTFSIATPKKPIAVMGYSTSIPMTSTNNVYAGGFVWSDWIEQRNGGAGVTFALSYDGRAYRINSNYSCFVSYDNGQTVVTLDGGYNYVLASSYSVTCICED